MSDFDEGTIRYTVKELLARIEAKVDVVTLQMDAKANREDVEHLKETVSKLVQEKADAEVASALEKRLNVLEHSSESAEKLKRDRRWLVGVAAATFINGVMIVSQLADLTSRFTG